MYQQLMEFMESKMEEILAKHHEQMHDSLLKSLRSAQLGSGAVACERPHDRGASKGAVKNKQASSTKSARTLDVPMPMPKRNSIIRNEDMPSSLHAPEPKNRSVPSLVEMESTILQGISGVRLTPTTSERTNTQPSQRAATALELEDLRPGPVAPAAPSESLLDLMPGGIPNFVTVHEVAEISNSRASPRNLFGSPRPSNEIVLPNTASMGNLMKDSQSAILDSFCDWTKDADLDVGSRFMLAIPPGMSVCLGVVSLLEGAGLCALYAFGIVKSNSYSITSVTCVLYGLLAACCMQLLRKALRSKDLNLAIDRLHLFVVDFQLHWSQVSGQEWRKYLVAWSLLVLCQAGTQGYRIWSSLQQGPLDPAEKEHRIYAHVLTLVCLVSFAVSSGIVMLTAYVQSHLLLGLDKTLDCWCCHMMRSPQFEFGVQSWNSMQALLKCVGRELAGSFLMVQASCSLGFIYVLANGVAYGLREEVEPNQMVMEALSALPLVFLFGLGMRLFSHGAALSEKCRIIPAFVNQIPGEESIDVDKQYLVSFITHSSAGFFVRDVKLTQEMFIKQFILVGGLLSGLFGALSRIYL